MAYNFSNQGIAEFYNAAITDAPTMETVIAGVSSDLKKFITDPNNFTLTQPQKDLINAIPDEVYRNIGTNLARALTNGYSIFINIGSFDNPNPPPIGGTRVSCDPYIHIWHDPDCTWHFEGGLRCSFE